MTLEPAPIGSHLPPADGDAAPEAPAWLMQMLRQAMEDVMAADLPPLQQASAIARLANLYLKAHNVAGLKAANKALLARLAALEAMGAGRDSSPAHTRTLDPDAALAAPAERAVAAGSEPVVSHAVFHRERVAVDLESLNHESDLTRRGNNTANNELNTPESAEVDRDKPAPPKAIPRLSE